MKAGTIKWRSNVRTAQQYIERLAGMKPNVVVGGEVLRRDDPLLMPGVRVMSLTFDLARDEDCSALTTAISHLTGERVNRFCHIHQSSSDLRKKQAMTRAYVQRTGFCIQRCMGIDALNALSVVTKDVDLTMGTDYHARFNRYLKHFQENDLTAACAQTDVKGDRGKRPGQQPDPDAYLHVVERRADGIVVRGAKNHITMAPQADEIIALPTRALVEGEEDWAVAFAIPADTDGVRLITRPAAPRQRVRLKAPIAEYGWSDSFVIFDDVFVPWDRVFLCGEWQFAGQLAVTFALFHRHSYTGCKPGLGDVLIGLVGLTADYQGIAKAHHVREKLADLVTITELVYSAGVAAAELGRRAPSGTFVPDAVCVNVGRKLAGESVYHEYNVLADVGGGLPATLPYEGDFASDSSGALLNKYITRVPTVSPENQERLFRTLSDYLCSGFGGAWAVAGVHGGGSPVMETIGILANYDLDEKKRIARALCGIPDA